MKKANLESFSRLKKLLKRGGSRSLFMIITTQLGKHTQDGKLTQDYRLKMSVSKKYFQRFMI